MKSFLVHLFLSLFLSSNILLTTDGVFYDVCANIGIASSMYICREVIENTYRPKD